MPLSDVSDKASPSAEKLEGNINWPHPDVASIANINWRPIDKPELARYFDVSARTVDNWIRARKIPYFKLGRLIRFSLPAVKKALSRYEVKEVSIS